LDKGRREGGNIRREERRRKGVSKDSKGVVGTGRGENTTLGLLYNLTDHPR